MKDKRFHALVMWWAIIALLILVVRIVVAQGFEVPRHQCMPVMVEWVSDSLPVQSFGCADVKGDTLILIPHIVNGDPKNVLGILKKDIKKIVALVPAQSATLKPRIGP